MLGTDARMLEVGMPEVGMPEVGMLEVGMQPIHGLSVLYFPGDLIFSLTCGISAACLR